MLSPERLQIQSYLFSNKTAKVCWGKELFLGRCLCILTMGSENKDAERASKEVTVVVNLRIKPGCEKDYDEWLGRFLVLQRKVPGYLGTTTIMETGPDSSERHIIHRFRDKASLEAWENSEDLHKQTEEVNKYSTPYLQKATGLETWFTLPGFESYTYLLLNGKWR